MKIYHQPILASKIIEAFGLSESSVVADLTTGEGGHAELIAPLIQNGKLLCMDRDSEILAIARSRLDRFTHIEYVCDTYNNFTARRLEAGFPLFDAVLVDMGVSMFHFKGAQRGFSFEDNNLDMRLNPDLPLTAEKIINTFSEKDLADIFYYYGEEFSSRRFAQAVVRHRPFFSAKDLAHCIRCAAGRNSKFHPATKIFQALRIYVNDELEIAENFLKEVIDNLAPGAILAILTFHSLEDRIVKNAFKEFTVRKLGNMLNKKPIVPDFDEIRRNPAARSAKLRMFKRSLCI